MGNPLDFERFLRAQAPVMAQVCSELQAGCKQSHWMWYIFPQLAGLGRSSTAQYYALGSLDEARTYLGHPVLGPRLIKCTALVNGVEGRSVREIFGYPDDLKFHSSMTLFTLAKPDEPTFAAALDKYFAGALDRLTTEKLGSP
jgi:uncharacterized protein (DUF1810 family)